MKKLDITAITNASQMPLKKGTLQFLQDSYTEITAATIKALIGANYSPTVVYVLSGGLNISIPPVYSTSAGAVFFNGEVFDLLPSSFTSSSTAVFSIIQSQFTVDADPVTFTDTTVRSIHNIRKMQIAQGLSGSGLADYSQGFFLNFAIPPPLVLTAPILAPYADNLVQIIGSFPNQIIYVPNTSQGAHPILGAGSLNVGDVPAGGIGLSVTFAAISTANYYVVGTMISNGVPSNDTCVVFTITARTTTSFTATFKETQANSQNVAFEYVLIAK